MNKIKINLLKKFGGMLKNVDPEKIDFASRTVRIGEVDHRLTEAVSPLFKKRGKAFYAEIAKLFYIPGGVTLLFGYFSLALLLGAEKSILWKSVAILPVASAFMYIWYSITCLEERTSMDRNYEKYLFLFPFASVLVAILSGQPGFYLSVLFFTGIGLFAYEEFLRKDALWMMKKGVKFWIIDDSAYSGFLIISEIQPVEEKKNETD